MGGEVSSNFVVSGEDSTVMLQLMLVWC